MKNKGFTLIELLAVIVILAIIALIVAPIVLNIIDDADKNSEEKSAKLYIHAVDLAIAKQNMSSRFTDATCTVNIGGNLTCGEITVPVDVNNKSEIKGGTITIQGRKIIAVTNLKVGNGTYNMGSDGKLVRNDENTASESSTQIIYRFTEDELEIGDSIIPGSKQVWCITNQEMATGKWRIDGALCKIGINCDYDTEEECNNARSSTEQTCSEVIRLAYNSCNDDNVGYTQEICNDRKEDYQSCEQGVISTTGLSSYTEDYTTLDSSVFIKHTVENDVIKKSDACFIKSDNLYCIQFNDFENSVASLNQIFGESNCHMVTPPFCITQCDNYIYLYCGFDSLNVTVYPSGDINISKDGSPNTNTCMVEVSKLGVNVTRCLTNENAYY